MTFLLLKGKSEAFIYKTQSYNNVIGAVELGMKLSQLNYHAWKSKVLMG